MTDDGENLILEHLRPIRRRVDGIADDMKDVKHRLNIIESGNSPIRREVLLAEETNARQRISIDRIVERLEKIERRLEPVPGE